MPHRPARTSEQDTSIGLFSSVFSFVSRELESFVANATGGAAEEVRVRRFYSLETS